MSWHDPVRPLDSAEAEYVGKIDWLWSRLSPAQKSDIVSSVSTDTLRQEHSRYCIIGSAEASALPHRAAGGNLLVGIVLEFARAIFYDGPSYEHILGRRATREERMVLDDIYYARIGGVEHQYGRANGLVRYYLSGMPAKR